MLSKPDWTLLIACSITPEGLGTGASVLPMLRGCMLPRREKDPRKADQGVLVLASHDAPCRRHVGTAKPISALGSEARASVSCEAEIFSSDDLFPSSSSA